MEIKRKGRKRRGKDKGLIRSYLCLWYKEDE